MTAFVHRRVVLFPGSLLFDVAHAAGAYTAAVQRRVYSPSPSSSSSVFVEAASTWLVRGRRPPVLYADRATVVAESCVVLCCTGMRMTVKIFIPLPLTLPIAAVSSLLSRHRRREVVAVGSPVSGRARAIAIPPCVRMLKRRSRRVLDTPSYVWQ